MFTMILHFKASKGLGSQSVIFRKDRAGSETSALYFEKLKRGSRARALHFEKMEPGSETLYFEFLKKWSLAQEPCALKRLSPASELEVGWSLIFYRGGF